MPLNTPLVVMCPVLVNHYLSVFEYIHCIPVLDGPWIVGHRNGRDVWNQQ